MSKLQIGRGAVFLYIENITTMLYGYAFWYILSKITTPDVIGISSSIISLATIFVSVASVGIPLGSQRFLGKLFSEGKFEDARKVVKASLLIITTGIITCTIFILTTDGWMFSNYNFNLVIITIVLVTSSTISTLLRYVIIASLETKKLLAISIVSSGIKLILTIFLVVGGSNEVGVMIGFTTAPLLSSIFFVFNVIALLAGTQKTPSLKFIQTLKQLLRASVVSWIPSLIDSIGAQMGTIVVLGIQGSAQAGIYFIAFQLTMGISAVIWALESVTYPAISAMSEGRKLVLWRVIKIGLIIVLPLSISILFYSTEIMQIFGYDYAEGSLPLKILLLSILPTAIAAGISILVYSYGNYKQVLIIGLSTTIPRIILYFIFISWYGSTGAALSYTVGAIIGFIVSVIVSRRIDITIYWKDVSLIFVIPIACAFILTNFKLHFVIGIILSVIFSYLLLLKLNILNRKDVQDSLAIFPANIASPITNTINMIGSKLNRNY